MATQMNSRTALGIEFRQTLHRAQAQTEIGEVTHQLDGAGEEVGQSYTDGSNEHSHDFAAHHGQHHIKGLHASEQAGILEDVAIGMG